MDGGSKKLKLRRGFYKLRRSFYKRRRGFYKLRRGFNNASGLWFRKNGFFSEKERLSLIE